MIYKYCRRCGKRLKGEENMARGYGKVCYKKALTEAPIPHIVPYQLTLFTVLDIQNVEAGKGKQGRQGKSKI